jgi:histidinol-phosphatase (PHP family)
MSREAAASGLFDAMAHLDYCLEAPAELEIKVEFKQYEEFAKKAIDEIARKKIAIEVNSGGLRKAAKNIFPSLELLEYAHAVGVPAVTIGSDAHRLAEFDFGLREAVEIAQKAGFENAWFFVERKPIEIPLSSL